MPYILLILLSFAVYSRSLNYGYVVDDQQASKQNKHYKWWSRLEYIAQLFYGAGLFQNKLYDHIFRVVLTSAISCMILSCFDNIWIAALWAVHPINNQLTLWLNGRRYQVSLLLGLMSYKFPIAGIVLFPLALYVHPVAFPLLIVTAVTVTPIAWLWALPSVLCYKRLLGWLKSRLKIQDFTIYKTFNWRKPVLAIKCLAEYVRECLVPKTFTMYHPDIWGVAELEGNRNRAYALNAQFWLSIAFLAGIGYIGWLCGRTCLIGLLIAFLGVFQWLGFYLNPTQLWAQRYACITSIGMMMFLYGFATHIGYQTEMLSIVFVWYLVVTMKDMEMYRDFYSFFWMHFLQQPHNQNAHYFGAIGFNNYADSARKEGKFNDMAMYASQSMACSLLWCFRNRKPDLIHQFALQQLEAAKAKSPIKGKGA